jgi:O-antigen ligase
MFPARFGRDNPSRFDLVSEGVIEAAWLLVLLVTPLFFLAFSDRPFDPSKSSVIRVLATMGGAAWAAKVLSGGRPWRPTGQPEGLARCLVLFAVIGGVVMSVGTALSPDPRMSWVGSYERSLGSSTHLAVLVLFLLVVGHLRRRAQLERVLAVVWWTSVPVCLFALLQTLGLDPIAPRQALARPSSTLGNPIFLGAYLGIAWFHSLGLLFVIVRRRDVGGWSGLRQGVVIAVCGIQLWALVASASRGPVLGVVSGLAIVVAFVVITGFRDADDAAISGRWRVGLTLVLLGLCAAVSIPAVRSATRAAEPSDGPTARIASGNPLTTTRAGTIQVRLILWQSAIDTIRSPVPIPAAGTEDGLHRWRPWIGYGTATTVFAMSHHVPLEMARLEAARAPDQAHNIVLQTLLGGGIFGIGAWLLVQVLALAMGAKAVGALQDRRSGRRLIAVVIAGAGLGALAPWIVLGDPLFSAPAGVAAALVGLTVWLLHRWWRIRARPALEAVREPLLGAVLFATWVSHLVETQFGLEVATTMAYGWITLAALTVTASGWLDRPESKQPHVERSGSLPGFGIVAGLATTLLIFVLRIDRVHAPDVLWTEPQSQLAAWWIILASAAAGLALVKTRVDATRMVLGSAVGAAGFLVVLRVYRRLGAATAETTDVPAQIEAIVNAEAALASAVLGMLVAAAIVWGWHLSRERESGRADNAPSARPIDWLRTGAAGAVGLVLVAAVWQREAREIAVSYLARGAMSLAATHRFAAGLDVIERARALRPAESRLALLRGRIAFDWALAARDPEVRDRAVSVAEAALNEALELAPFNADHVANLGRWHFLAAGTEPSAPHRDEHIDAGIRRLQRALVMRPGAVEWHRDLALAMKRRGDLGGAVEALEPMLRVLPDHVPLLVELADLNLERGRRALAAGDTELASRSIAEAERLSTSAASIDPNDRRVRALLEASRALASGDAD